MNNQILMNYGYYFNKFTQNFKVMNKRLDF